MALSELLERCYRTIGHYRTLSEYYRSSLSDYRTGAQDPYPERADSRLTNEHSEQERWNCYDMRCRDGARRT